MSNSKQFFNVIHYTHGGTADRGMSSGPFNGPYPCPVSSVTPSGHRAPDPCPVPVK
jgi:hypothetical protein